MNPSYQRVVVRIQAKFYPQYDENQYKKQLNEDITRLLSPWAFDNTEDITFDLQLHRSTLIEYMENLPYVDYLGELDMALLPVGMEEAEDPSDPAYQASLKFLSKVAPASPRHILVSAKDHIISTDVRSCTNPIIIEAETCRY